MKRLDTANRSFFALVAVALVPYLLIGVVSCGLLTIIAQRVSGGGLSALSAGPGDLRPLVAVFGFVAAGTLVAIVSFARQLGATRRLVGRVRALGLPLPSEMHAAAARTGLGGRLDLVDASEAFSFAYGFPRARVAMSRGLLETASEEELEAVLQHERHHVRNLDPLKVVLARVLSSAYFFLPALRGLRARYSTASELAADRRAMDRAGRSALAGALYRVVRGPAWDELATAAAIGGPELLAVRITQLENGREPAIAPVSRAAGVTTMAVLLLMVAAIVASVMAVGGLNEVLRTSMGDHESQQEMNPGWHDLWWAVPAVALSLGQWSRWRRRHRHAAVT